MIKIIKRVSQTLNSVKRTGGGGAPESEDKTVPGHFEGEVRKPQQWKKMGRPYL